MKPVFAKENLMADKPKSYNRESASTSTDWSVTRRPFSPHEYAGGYEVIMKKDKQTLVYTPKELPYGVVEYGVKKIKEHTFVLTVWAHGARTLVYRVFAPELMAEKPICEVISFTGGTELRISRNQLQIRTIDENSKISWTDCFNLEGRNK